MKRFTDTDKWERPWFRKLPRDYRDLWMFIVDKCDAAGVWYVDMELASFMIGSDLNYGDALVFFGKQVEEIEKGARWFILDFVEFQYGHLSEDCKPHLKIISELKSLGLLDRVPHNLPHTLPDRGLSRVQDKEKERKKKYLSLDGGVGETIPDDLKMNEPEIRDWLEYKRQKGQRYKPKGLEALWRSIRAIPAEKRKESIEHSMANNWAGLFVKNGGNDGRENANDKLHSAIGGVERPDSKYAGVVRTVRTGR